MQTRAGLRCERAVALRQDWGASCSRVPISRSLFLLSRSSLDAFVMLSKLRREVFALLLRRGQSCCSVCTLLLLRVAGRPKPKHLLGLLLQLLLRL